MYINGYFKVVDGQTSGEENETGKRSGRERKDGSERNESGERGAEDRRGRLRGGRVKGA